MLLLVTSALAGVTLGAGVRDDPAIGGVVDGVRVFGRVPLSRAVGLEIGGYVHLGGAEPLTDWQRATLDVAYASNPDTNFTFPVRYDAQAVSVLVDWSFGPRPRVAELTGGMHLVGGIEGRRVASTSVGGQEHPLEHPEGPVHALHLSPALGFGLDVAWDRWGMRFTAMDRASIEDEPDYGNVDANGEPVSLGKRLYLKGVFALEATVTL